MMKFDDRIEAELGARFSAVQSSEDTIYAQGTHARAVHTLAPFLSVKRLATVNFVMVHGPDTPPPQGPARGGLSAWQVRRAKRMMAVQRRPALSIAEVAQACGVSESHFVREFKQSTGVTPHQWAMAQRVVTAKDLLLHTRLSLERVAAGSGFFDPSHLSRWFKRVTGENPRSWQKARVAHAHEADLADPPLELDVHA